MAQQYPEAPLVARRRRPQWSPTDVMAFVDRQWRANKLTDQQARMAKASVVAVFTDRLGARFDKVRLRDGDELWVSLDFAETSGHPHAGRVAAAFDRAVGAFLDSHPAPPTAPSAAPSGLELANALRVRQSPVASALKAIYGEHWQQRHPLSAEIEAVLPTLGRRPTTETSILSAFRRSFAVLAAEAPELNLPEIRRRNELPVDEDLSPTGKGIRAAVQMARRDGLITAPVALRRRSAVHLALRAMFGDRWETKSLQDFDLETPLRQLNSERRLQKDVYTDLRWAVEDFRRVQTIDWGIRLDPPLAYKRWERTSDFPPTARGIVSLIQHRVAEGDVALHKRNLAPPVKWVIERAMGEGWEDADLTGTNPLQLLGRIEPCPTLRNYASRYRAAIRLYAEAFPDRLVLPAPTVQQTSIDL